MSRDRPEIDAEMLWQYVEHLRTGGRALSRPEVRDLAESLELAGSVPEALEEPAADAARAAVRARVEAAMGRESVPPPRVPRRPIHVLVPRWGLLGGGAALASLLGALLTVGWWHRSQPVLLPQPVPSAVSGVSPMDEGRAHVLLTRMATGRTLPARDERDVMWHMLICPGCFDEYRRLRGERTAVRPSPNPPAAWPRQSPADPAGPVRTRVVTSYQ